MDLRSELSGIFGPVSSDLLDEIVETSVVSEFATGTEILREGQYVKVIPIVLRGLIKVCTRLDEKELLLYYIKPRESCVMSFAAGLKNEPSKIFATTEEPSELLLLPVEKVKTWVSGYPELNSLFFQQYNLRYTDLIDTVNQLLFEKLDKRVYVYLKEKVELTGRNPLVISHRQIATDLGTAREVVSRVIKKLEAEKKLRQFSNSIEIS